MRNIISGNEYGVLLAHEDTTVLEGNYIGTDPTGIFAEGNGGYGVELDYGVGDGGTKATVGGLTPIPGTGAGNVISGNGLSNIWIFQAQPQAIEGNIIGLNATGTAALGVATEGIYIWDTTIPITIGGTAAGARNVISGNDGAGIFLDDAGYNTGIGPVKNLVVEGNDIGTDITGTIAIGNGTTGNGITITASNSNTIGGSAAGAGNVISGNSGDGVEITGSGTTGNVVAGNYIGTDITGTVAVPNGSDGVEIDTSASGNTIGGTTALARNIISGNTAWGVGILRSATDNVVAGNFIGADVTGDVCAGQYDRRLHPLVGQHDRRHRGRSGQRYCRQRGRPPLRPCPGPDQEYRQHRQRR